MTLRLSSMVGASLLGLLACGETGRSEAVESRGAKSGSGAEVGQARASGRSQTRMFGNWTAVCNNGDDCWAYATSGSSDSGWVLLRLAAGPAARPELIVGDWGDAAGPLTLAIDGQSVAASGSEVVAGGDEAIIDRFDDMPGVIRRMTQGQTLALTRSDPDSSPSISLQGATAALLWIDERQGRLETTTALIRRGDRPASSVPVAPDLPMVKAAAAVSQGGLADEPTLPASLEALPTVKACRAAMDWGNGVAPRKDDGVARLSDDTLLWTVLCFQGPYNEGHRFFLTGNEGQNPRAVRLRSTDQEGEDAGQDDDYMLINAGYNPDSRTISSFSKGRGLGDCGGAYVWTWTGREFVLTDEKVMQRCAGMGADLWPRTWRSR